MTSSHGTPYKESNTIIPISRGEGVVEFSFVLVVNVTTAKLVYYCIPICTIYTNAPMKYS